MIDFALVVGFAFGIAPALVLTAFLLLPAPLFDVLVAGFLLVTVSPETGVLVLLAVAFVLAGAALLAALAVFGCCGVFVVFFATDLVAAGFALVFAGLEAAFFVDFTAAFFFVAAALFGAGLALADAALLRAPDAAGFLLAATAFLPEVAAGFFAVALLDAAFGAVFFCFSDTVLLATFVEEVVLADATAVFLVAAVAFGVLFAAFFAAGAFFFLEAIRSNSLNISLTHW